MLSVVVTTYAPHHRYLSEALQSIDYTCEIIIVNDSPDAILNHKDYPNYKVINRRHGNKWGAGGARNRGVTISNFDLILFLDGDDYLMPGALAALHNKYKQLKLDTGQDWIIYGDLIRSDTNAVWPIGQQYRGRDYDQSPLNPTKANRPYLCLIPKKYHYAVGGFVTEEEAPTWEDLIYEADMWAMGFPEAKINMPTYVYRWSENGRRAIGNDPTMRKTVTDFMYDRYSDFYKGVKPHPFLGEIMACSTCGGRNRINPNKVPPQSMAAGLQRTLPTTESFEELWLVYSGPHPKVTFKGSFTGLEYAFGTSSNYLRKKVVNKLPEQIDRFKEVHLLDAQEFYQRRMRTHDEFRAEVIIVAQMAHVTEAPVVTKPPKGQALNISDLTIGEMRGLLEKGGISGYQAELWLMEEEQQEKPRKGMVTLLSEHIEANAIRFGS